MAKKKATTKKVAEKGLDKAQTTIVQALVNTSNALLNMQAGAAIDNLSTRLGKFATQTEDKFIKFNNAAGLKTARQEKLAARKAKLQEQLYKIESLLQ